MLELLRGQKFDHSIISRVVDASMPDTSAKSGGGNCKYSDGGRISRTGTPPPLRESPRQALWQSAGAHLVHHLDESNRLLVVRLGQHAMAQVEDVPRSAGHFVEDVLRAPLERRQVREQQHGVEIPLDSPVR